MNIKSVSSGMAEVIYVIDKLYREKSWPPSRTDVSELVGKSIACIGGYVKRLKVRGLIEVGKNGHGLRVTPVGKRYLKELEAAKCLD